MSQALALVKPAERAEGVADELGRFAPSEPLVWLFAQGRYASEQGVPALTRWYARLDNLRLTLWYSLLRQPRVSREGRLVLPNFRVSCDTRAQARAQCRSKYDYVYAMPHGTHPLDSDLRHNPTLCRPLAEVERDAEQADLYAGADLRDFTCGALARENRELRAALGEMSARLSKLAGDT